jgi:hypothetical protein
LPRKVQYDLAVDDSVRKVDRNAVFEKGSFSYSPLIYEIVNKVKRQYFLRNPKSNYTLLKGYLGYELKKVSCATAEQAPGVAQRDVDRNNERAQNQVRQARVGRRLGPMARGNPTECRTSHTEETHARTAPHGNGGEVH